MLNHFPEEFMYTFPKMAGFLSGLGYTRWGQNINRLVECYRGLVAENNALTKRLREESYGTVDLNGLSQTKLDYVQDLRVVEEDNKRLRNEIRWLETTNRELIELRLHLEKQLEMSRSKNSLLKNRELGLSKEVSQLTDRINQLNNRVLQINDANVKAKAYIDKLNQANAKLNYELQKLSRANNVPKGVKIGSVAAFHPDGTELVRKDVNPAITVLPGDTLQVTYEFE